ncbi:SpoIIE family protein phosphatase [Streptomyces sp. NPDC005281]|uniref:SpoIIE family protein phosphatase n=1 Tax=Streptomyces sp. NPDC005281 TaxID=3155712 RepID=UPI0033A7F536
MESASAGKPARAVEPSGAGEPAGAVEATRAVEPSGAVEATRVGEPGGPEEPGPVEEPSRPPARRTSPAGKPSGVEPLEEALTVAVRRTGASGGGIYVVDETRQLLGLKVACGLPGDIAVSWRQVPVTASVPVCDAFREDRVVWVGSQEEMALSYPQTAAALPYRFTLAAAPLAGRSRCWGALFLIWPAGHSGRASPREKGNFAALGRRVARVLDEAGRTFVPPDEPHMISLDGASEAFSLSAHAPADLMERLPEGFVALDLEGRITFLTSRAASLLGRRVSHLLGTRPWQSLPWMDQVLVEDHYRTAVMSREPVGFTVLRPPDTWLDIDLHPDSSGISVRIKPRGSRPGEAPGAVVPAAAASPAASVGRLYQLVHLAAALTDVVGVQDVVDLIAVQILPAFGADGMVLSAADAGRLKIVGHHGYDPQTIERLDGLPVNTRLTPAGEALISGNPLFFADPDELARGYPAAPRISDKQAWAFLPLISDARPVGCCILTYARPHAFTADDRAVLTSLGGLVAQALDRARLYDAKHALAHTLQRALLPRGLPTVRGLEVAARYLPAGHGMDVGGDFYDLIRLDHATAAAVIGDVQGHNIAAAALMGQVRTAVHATAGARPDEVLARTNRVLADLEPDLLVSCLYAHIDLARRQVSLASAGHVPPLLHRPGQRPEVLEIEPGPLLGIGVELPYPITTVEMTPGTTLALYTDGLVEVPGTDLDRMTSGLAQLLADGSRPERLVDKLIHHSWPQGIPTDDIAVLLLKAEES